MRSTRPVPGVNVFSTRRTVRPSPHLFWKAPFLVQKKGHTQAPYTPKAVSYTHLDVYKRQHRGCRIHPPPGCRIPGSPGAPERFPGQRPVLRYRFFPSFHYILSLIHIFIKQERSEYDTEIRYAVVCIESAVCQCADILS